MGETGLRSGATGSWWDGVEVAVAIAVKHNASGWNILNRKTKCVKLYGTVVLASILASKEQVMD